MGFSLICWGLECFIGQKLPSRDVSFYCGVVVFFQEGSPNLPQKMLFYMVLTKVPWQNVGFTIRYPLFYVDKRLNSWLSYIIHCECCHYEVTVTSRPSIVVTCPTVDGRKSQTKTWHVKNPSVNNGMNYQLGDRRISEPSTVIALNWTKLVGGWTNPFEKYARQIGSCPQGSGGK